MRERAAANGSRVRRDHEPDPTDDRLGRHGGAPPPRALSLVALVIASTAMIASSYAPPFVGSSFHGETTFEAPGEDRVVRATVVLDPVSAAEAQSASLSSWPNADVATVGNHPRSSDGLTEEEAGALRDGSGGTTIPHPLTMAIRQVGPGGPLPIDPDAPGSLDISTCRDRPGEPCSLDVEVRLSWSGPVPATAVWDLSAKAYFDFAGGRSALDRGASVGVVVAGEQAQLSTIVLAGAGAGLLAAVLAAVLGARLLAGSGESGSILRLRRRLPLVLSAVLVAGAGWLIVGTGVIRALAHEQELGIVILVQAGMLVVAHRRFGGHDGLMEKLVIASVAFGSLPVFLLTIAGRQAYRPVEVFAVVAAITFVVALARFARRPLSAPSTGEPLSRRRVVFVEAWIGFATLSAVFGATQDAIYGGSTAWFAELGTSHAPLVIAAVALLLAVARWLHGRSRVLTLFSLLLLLGGGGFAAVSLSLTLDHPWLSTGEVLLDFITRPMGILSIAAVVFGIAGMLGRRLRPSVVRHAPPAAS